ncbi:MAG: hypothetical protein AAF462_03050 [Thermodesulfobacteriota bacterium]
MLQILCMVDSEDYWQFNLFNEQNKTVNYFGYIFEVEGGKEGLGTSTIRILVFEFIDIKLAVGFIVPNDLEIQKDFRLIFIANDSPTKEIPVECKLSDEVKKAAYMGDDLEKIEYIGFTLEKFYDENNAKFYLHDLRPPTEEQGQPEQP